MLSRISLLAVLALLMAVLSPLNAAAIADVEFQDQVTVSGKSLQLNGLGLRTATAFKVKVYAIGLYLEESSSDAAAIINSSETKRIKMHFLHKVSADEISEGWTEGFENNNGDLSGIKTEIGRFNSSMRDMKVGETLVLDIAGDTVEVLINGASVESIQGSEFLKALLAIWLGPKPPNEPLKEGILGQ
jgi:hypothetical protein